MRSVRIPYFRIWYSSSFIVLFLITLVLTLVSPADLIYNSIRNRVLGNVFSVGGTYIVTLVVCAFVWSSRIYTNRAVLKDIPKAFIPVDHGEVPRKVNRMIVKQWERSAIIAWDGRPRDVRKELEQKEDRNRPIGHQHSGLRRRRRRVKTIISAEAALATWGPIAHPGWSSPASQDLPNLHYSTVIRELPNLIEAKAVSLAPPDPAFLQPGAEPTSPENTIPDARIVALLQRAPTMGLRDYLTQLAAFNLINPPDLAPTFLNQYESARFSASPLSEPQFRDLMATFAAILTGMTALDPALIEQALDDYDSDTSSINSTSSLNSNSSAIRRQQAQARADVDDDPSDKVSALNLSFRPSMLHRTSSSGTVLTAPSRMSRAHTLYHTASLGSLQSMGSVGPVGVESTADGRSIRSNLVSLRSANSVIRLRSGQSEAGELPYHITPTPPP